MIELIADSGGLLGAYVGWCIYALYDPFKKAASKLCVWGKEIAWPK